MISLTLPASAPRPHPTDARPRRTAVSTIAALALVSCRSLPAAGSNRRRRRSSSSSGGSATDPVVARVNGMDIRESHLAMAEDDLGAELAATAARSPARADHQLCRRRHAGRAGRRGANLQNSDDFKQRLAFLRSKLLMGLMLQDHAQIAVNDEALRKVYDEQIKPMGATEEVRARHILFRADPKDEKAQAEAQARARAALERIKKGEDFAARRQRADRGPLRQGERRRPRLLHQGPDGAGIRQHRVPDASGAGVQSGPHASSAGTSSSSRTAATGRCRNSTRSGRRSRPSWCAAPRPSWSAAAREGEDRAARREGRAGRRAKK